MARASTRRGDHVRRRASRDVRRRHVPGDRAALAGRWSGTSSRTPSSTARGPRAASRRGSRWRSPSRRGGYRAWREQRPRRRGGGRVAATHPRAQPDRPGGAAHHRPGAPRAHRGRGGRAVVHGAVRSRLAARVVHGPAGRPVARARARCRRWPTTRARRSTRRPRSSPGRILHEVRLGVDTGLALGGGGVYYGTADATPLFVVPRRRAVPVGRRRRRAGGAAAARRPRAGLGRRATATATVTASSSTSGCTTGGLANQGWKDSWDGITFADGSPAARPDRAVRGPGLRLRRLRRPCPARPAPAGDDRLAQQWRDRAAELKDEFNRDFWLPDRGCSRSRSTATSDRSTRRASNIGHCLWTGIVDEDKARPVADRLLSPAMFTGWGVRTLGLRHGRVQPGELPQRVGVAPRQRPDRRRPDAVRVRRARPAHRRRSARGGRPVRRPAARAVLRVRRATSTPTGRSRTRRRARRRPGRRRRRSCSCGRCCGTTRACRTGRSGWHLPCPRASAGCASTTCPSAAPRAIRHRVQREATSPTCRLGWSCSVSPGRCVMTSNRATATAETASDTTLSGSDTTMG